MAVMQKRSKRKVSGGRYKKLKVKRKAQMGNLPTNTKIAAEKKHKIIRVLGGNYKQRLLTANIINLLDKKTRKSQKAKIITVEECPANRNYVRRNILVKGTIVKTDKGRAVITSRPG